MRHCPLFLMRHGVPEGPGRLIGHSDVAADPDGTRLCVERARGLDFVRLVTSDLARAFAPGAIIAAERQMPHQADARWRELDFGAWEGSDPAVLPQEALGRFWDDPDLSPPPGGERWAGLCARVAAAVADIAEPTLVISHAGAMRAALATLCGFAYRHAWAIDLPYGALVSLRFWPGARPGAQITGLVA